MASKQHDGQGQATEAMKGAQVGTFEVKTVLFAIAKQFFNAHATVIQYGIRVIGDGLTSPPGPLSAIAERGRRTPLADSRPPDNTGFHPDSV